MVLLEDLAALVVEVAQTLEPLRRVDQEIHRQLAHHKETVAEREPLTLPVVAVLAVVVLARLVLMLAQLKVHLQVVPAVMVVPELHHQLLGLL